MFNACVHQQPDSIRQFTEEDRDTDSCFHVQAFSSGQRDFMLSFIQECDSATLYLAAGVACVIGRRQSKTTRHQVAVDVTRVCFVRAQGHVCLSQMS